MNKKITFTELRRKTKKFMDELESGQQFDVYHYNKLVAVAMPAKSAKP